MCIVAYTATYNKTGVAEVSFVVGRSRIAPMRQLSIPKLELQPALYSAKVRSMIIREHEITIGKVYH